MILACVSRFSIFWLLYFFRIRKTNRVLNLIYLILGQIFPLVLTIYQKPSLHPAQKPETDPEIEHRHPAQKPEAGSWPSTAGSPPHSLGPLATPAIKNLVVGVVISFQDPKEVEKYTLPLLQTQKNRCLQRKLSLGARVPAQQPAAKSATDLAASNGHQAKTNTQKIQ